MPMSSALIVLKNFTVSMMATQNVMNARRLSEMLVSVKNANIQSVPTAYHS